MSRSIDYGNLMHRAMRSLIQNVLERVARDGLPGDHHFFITSDTLHPDVQIADWLSDRYPEDMTIVIQHWYENLTVTDDGFAITLNFGDRPEPMFIPYDAIRTFVDPSVEFGLRFETHASADDDDEETEDAADPGAPMAENVSVGDDTPRKDAEIVSLDKFRK